MPGASIKNSYKFKLLFYSPMLFYSVGEAIFRSNFKNQLVLLFDIMGKGKVSCQTFISRPSRHTPFFCRFALQISSGV